MTTQPHNSSAQDIRKSDEIIGDRHGFQWVLSADGTWEVSAAT